MLYTTGGKSRVENVWQAGVNWKEEAAVLRDRRRGGSGTTREGRRIECSFARRGWPFPEGEDRGGYSVMW